MTTAIINEGQKMFFDQNCYTLNIRPCFYKEMGLFVFSDLSLNNRYVKTKDVPAQMKERNHAD
jgi:hypothetical protein